MLYSINKDIRTLFDAECNAVIDSRESHILPLLTHGFFGLSVDKGKASAIEKWPTPSSQKDLLSFLGLAGYYHRFICGFAELALPLSEFTKKDCVWNWGSLQEFFC